MYLFVAPNSAATVQPVNGTSTIASFFTSANDCTKQFILKSNPLEILRKPEG